VVTPVADEVIPADRFIDDAFADDAAYDEVIAEKVEPTLALEDDDDAYGDDAMYDEIIDDAVVPEEISAEPTPLLAFEDDLLQDNILDASATPLLEFADNEPASVAAVEVAPIEDLPVEESTTDLLDWSSSEYQGANLLDASNIAASPVVHEADLLDASNVANLLDTSNFADDVLDTSPAPVAVAQPDLLDLAPTKSDPIVDLLAGDMFRADVTPLPIPAAIISPIVSPLEEKEFLSGKVVDDKECLKEEEGPSSLNSSSSSAGGEGFEIVNTPSNDSSPGTSLTDDGPLQ